MTNESILKDADGIYDEFATPEKAAESVKLKVCMYVCGGAVVFMYHITWSSKKVLFCLVSRMYASRRRRLA